MVMEVDFLTIPTVKILKIQDGVDRHCEKSKNRRILATV